jgi:hypothetical protein
MNDPIDEMVLIVALASLASAIVYLIIDRKKFIESVQIVCMDMVDFFKKIIDKK